MSEPAPNAGVPDRAERRTTTYGMRVPGDDEPGDLVTVLGELLDTADTELARAARGQVATALLFMGA